MSEGPSSRQVRTAIVLGAGGTVGIAYHAGVVKALADHGLRKGGHALRLARLLPGA